MTLSGSGDGQSGSVRAHFVLVPMMAQGHTIPMTDMARLLAEHGAQGSFITTPEPLMAYLLEQQRLPPSCIISDMVHWWTGDIARELGIPRLTFSGFCGFSSLVRSAMTFTGSGDGQSGSARAHFVLVPMLAQGHTIPMTDMARLLAEHGAQLVELGLGLETSRKPFIWVIKAGAKLPEVKEWLADEFEERVKNRGMVIRGWAPQLMILQHQAIGGFVTHCGWNSTIEGICAGVPMITWPHFGEQFLNEKLLVDVLKTGMEVGVKGVTQWGSENQEVMVTRDEVQKAVNTLMDEGVAAEEMRVRAKDCAIKARRAFDEGGSSYDNIRLLIQEMEIKTNACRSVVDTDGNKLSFLV
ncbi:UDP-glycosyltransferase 73C7 [Triticum urartu]|uniref:UDP-glycosyltransferase 73C7 n=1 Tax=Triticum urartu TaxID=4572 RepID=M7ZBT3_TRIUA|nr:UDP-glycosyltransferase 73C7 [Triticum urartu]